MKKRRDDGAPEIQFRRKSCSGKKRYLTERDAADMIETQRDYGRKMDGVHPYMCEFCGKWHIGHRMEDG